ncbi:MAG: hypothetical protein K2Y37_16770 [Pirellulales bacterium]|nr:hypothetical protein [Pirellulales bacterium]
MVVNPQDTVLIVHRRLFEKDSTRFFIGVVEECDAGLIKATGFTYFQDMMTGHVNRKDDPRTKIVPLGAGTVLVYLLQGSPRIEDLHFVHSGSKTFLVDNARFRMDLTEH